MATNEIKATRDDNRSLFSIPYGLFLVTSSLDGKANGLIVNTVTQVTNTPNRVAVTINKDNYSHTIIKEIGILNVNCLTTETPFSIFQNFGFQSGKDKDKFEGISYSLSENGLPVLNDYVNTFISLKVTDYVDFDTHGMFICEITDSGIINDKETVTYSYYQKHIKPRPEEKKSKGYVCKICGYVYEGEDLPEDFICPWCKHPASDFEKR